MSAGPERTEPAAPAPFAAPSEPPTPPSPPPAPHSAVTTSMAAFGGSESCPNCAARMATDQRYCLNCGHRRGDPRLPFMDAVAFMESMSGPGAAAGTPPPPPPAEPKSNRMNANAALIAGVATLVLAIGVGFLIGRSGHENSGNVQAEAPIKVIEVGGGGGGETAEASSSSETGGAEAGGKAKKKGGENSALKGENSGKATAKAKKNSQEGANGQAESVEKVLHSTVPQAKSEAQVGDACEEGTAGCEGKEFTGNFFGE